MKTLVLITGSVLLFSCLLAGQTQNKKASVYLTVDCDDPIGAGAASAFREKIRGSNGYVLEFAPTKGHSGSEVILTCVPIPGREKTAAAVSYVFDVFLPDEARYFVTAGVGVVGDEAIDNWARTIFSQFDNWASKTQRIMSK